MDIYVTKLFVTSYVICFLSFIGLFVTMEAFLKLDRFLRQDGVLGAMVRCPPGHDPHRLRQSHGTSPDPGGGHVHDDVAPQAEPAPTPLKASGVGISYA